MKHLYHVTNGLAYRAPADITTLDEYKDWLRSSYGSLRGVRFTRANSKDEAIRNLMGGSLAIQRLDIPPYVARIRKTRSILSATTRPTEGTEDCALPAPVYNHVCAAIAELEKALTAAGYKFRS